MASVTRSTRPLVITTRLDVSQGKTISVQDFLRSLKRPGSKAQTSKVQLSSRNQDGPPSAAVKIDHLPDHAALGEDRSTSPPIKKLPADNPLIPRQHEDSSTKLPQSDTPQNLCSSPLAKSAGSVTEPVVTGLSHSLDAPKAVPTYGRKSKPKLPPTEDLPGSSPLSCAQPSTADQGQIPENYQSTSQVQELENLVELQNDQQGALRVVPSTVEAVIKESSRKRRKRRRAPVNELALVAELPMHANSPEESSEQGRAKHKDPYEANVGRQMTKSRRDLVTPRRNSIDPQDFKFPPATPKNARSPGWRPGSGFEGTTVEPLAPTTLTTRRRPVRPTKTVRSAVPPTRPLDLYIEISPTAKASNSPLLEKAPKSLALPPEATRRLQLPNAAQDPSTDYGELIQHTDKAAHTGETISSEIQMLTALMKPRAHVNQLAKSEVLDDGLFRRHSSSRQRSPSSRRRGVDSPAIRRPSKSERNGWLKRRKRASFADENEQRTPQSAKDRRQPDDNDDTERLFEAHNATWYGKDAQADPCFRASMQRQGWPTSIVHSPQFQAMRSSQSLEVKNSQGQPEAGSPELGDYPIYPIQDVGLNVGKYFSNAVQKLSSEEKGSHTVVRRKSQIQKLAYGGGQSEMEGSLELGVTPRLKRTLSSVPFRPPFKNL